MLNIFMKPHFAAKLFQAIKFSINRHSFAGLTFSLTFSDTCFIFYAIIIIYTLLTSNLERFRLLHINTFFCPVIDEFSFKQSV
jgi:hypothetical protein